MKFIYGKQDFKTMERGQENCYLLTNGLGGFSSTTMAGSNTRNDHSLLMACLKAPNHRYNMIYRLSETICVNGVQHFISSQEFEDGEKEDGYQHISYFSFEDFPKWIYHVSGIEICKTIGMKPGANTVAVSYTIHNRSKEECQFLVTPYMQFTKKGEHLTREQEFVLGDHVISSNDMTVFFQTNGEIVKTKLCYETDYYSYDACDGRREYGLAAANHKIVMTVPEGRKACFHIVYSMTEVTESPIQIMEEMQSYRNAWKEQAGFKSPVAQMLAKSAGQFIAYRESTGGETILAGFPFFEDWGRDTMIALAGCGIATGQYDTVKSILRTFLANERKGLMPNLFPEGGNEPAYNTVDAALLFINSVYLYYGRTKDKAFVKEAYPVMETIITSYRDGTDYGIYMDEDGLISAGEGLDQVTWMDVRVDDILPTPRHGKPVEINAYWYNALRIMEIFAPIKGEDAQEYVVMGELVKGSFKEKFWLEEKSCLRDVLSGTKADVQIRCNQIWAVSMPFTMLEEVQERQVVEMVFETLYTPYGLRTLAMEDEEFKPCYGGSQLERDLAYHQGTVWTFPLGGYYLAYLKVHGYNEAAKRTVREQLEVMESALREGCIGQLPEIYDGVCPASSKGCFAQAWSVGEILRVYAALE